MHRRLSRALIGRVFSLLAGMVIPFGASATGWTAELSPEYAYVHSVHGYFFLY